MLHVFRHLPKVNFLGAWKLAFALSWLVIGAGIWSFVHRGGLDVGRGDVYGIDFKGGDTATLGFAQRVNEDAIRQSLERGKFGDSYIQYQRDLPGGPEVLTLKLAEGQAEKVIEHLQKDFPDAQFTKLGK